MTADGFAVLPPEIVDAATRGWRILPVYTRGKRPRVKGWRAQATSDVPQLNAWARQFPGCNWGLATGMASGVVVIDVDGAAGRASLANLEREGFTLPTTLTVKTGRPDGGEHRYYRLSSEIDIHNDQAGKIGPNIDIRGTGGVAVLPPSVHANGNQYRFIDPSMPVADLPGWIIELLTLRGLMPKATANASTQVVEKGERTPHLVSLAGTMQKRGMALEAIEAALLAENEAKCFPRLADTKVRSIAADIVARYPAAKTDAGAFFLLNSRSWEKVMDLGMNPAIAYLVLTSGTGRGNKVTRWSTKSLKTYAGVGHTRAKGAIEQLMAGGFMRRAEGHTDSKPRYEFASYRELMENSFAKSPSVEADSLHGELRSDLPEGLHSTGEIDSADFPSQRALIAPDSRAGPKQQEPCTEDLGDHAIWLPNSIVTENSTGEESPIQRLRSAGRISALKLFVALYVEQNLRDDGGINPRYICQRFDRLEIGQQGPYKIWAFKRATDEQWRTGPLDATSSQEMLETDGDFARSEDLELLQNMGLLSFVPHIFENDTDAAEPIHVFGIGGISEDPIELEIGIAADNAARAMAPASRLKEAEDAGFQCFCPAQRTKPTIQMIGVARLRFRPQTKRTKAWLAELYKKAPDWINTFGKLAAKKEKIAIHRETNVS